MPAKAWAQATGTRASQQTDRQTDRTDRTRPDQTDRPDQAPKQPQEITDTVLASTLLERDPKTLPAWMQKWLTRKRCVCPVLVVVVSKRNHRPLPPGAGQKPVPHLYPYSVGWEARRPLEPHSQPRRGRGITCKRKVWPRTQEQRPRDKRVRAEDLKSLVVLGDEASHKGEKNASGTKKQKENNGTPTLRCPQEKCACVLKP